MTGKTGKAGTGQAKQDRQNRTVKTGQSKQDRQTRTDKPGRRNLPTELSYSKPLLSPCRAALGSETGFSLWGEEKREYALFFFRARRFRFFSSHFRALFWLRARERESAKARKKRRRPPLRDMDIT